MTDIDDEVTEPQDPLAHFWPCFDMPDAVVSAQETVWWPPGVLDALRRLRLLVPTTPAAHVACTSCAERHVEEVEITRGVDGRMLYRIPCPENLFVDVGAHELLRWQPDLQMLARRLKELLGMKDSRVRDRVPQRLWRLGSSKWKGQPREVYLARGLAWPDGGSIAAQVPVDARPLLFVAASEPPSSIWQATAPLLIPLPAVLAVIRSDLVLDHESLAWRVARADEAAVAAGRLAETDLKRRVNRYTEQRLAEGSTMDLIKAFDSLGLSTRKSEEEMRRRGMSMDHATIARKRQHLAPRPPTSSTSVVRHASSQPRDKRNRPIADAEPSEE